MKDAEFLAEAARMNADVGPVGGEEIARIIAQAYAMKPEVLARAKSALTAKD